MKEEKVMNKKYRSLVICLNLAVIGCTVTPGTNPFPTPTPGPVQSTGASASPTPVPSVSASVPQTSPTPSAGQSPDVSTPDNTGKLVLNGKGYLRTPDTAFLAAEPFELEAELSLNELKQETQTIFDIYDNNVSPVKSHYSVQLENNKTFVINARTEQQQFSRTAQYNSLEAGKDYKLRFRVENKKVNFFINDQELLSFEMDNNTFTDKNGTRVMTLGANSSGNNLLAAKINYLNIANVLSYTFDRTIEDQSDKRLDASGIGEYIVGNIIPSAAPTVIPTIAPTAVPKPVNHFVNNYEIPLQITKQESEIISRETFNSPGFILGESRYLNDHADIRFITEVEKFEHAVVRITGNENVYVVDLGERHFDGIDLNFLKTKVNYSLQRQYYSSSNKYSPVYRDHLYAIKTERYGAEPLYAKLQINRIIYSGEKFIDLKAPKIVAQPAYTDAGRSTLVDNNTSFQYYVGTYDGVGETVPVQLTLLPGRPDASSKNIEFSFEVPYGAKGYTVYRVENGQNIYKIGPYLAEQDSVVVFTDNGISGTTVSSLPASGTTVKSGYKPAYINLPERVDFKYKFYGEGKEF